MVHQGNIFVDALAVAIAAFNPMSMLLSLVTLGQL